MERNFVQANLILRPSSFQQIVPSDSYSNSDMHTQCHHEDCYNMVISDSMVMYHIMFSLFDTVKASEICDFYAQNK